MEGFLWEPDAFVGFEVAALAGEGNVPEFFLLFQMPVEHLFLGGAKTLRKLRQLLHLLLVDMGFDAGVLGTQQGGMHAVADSPEAFVNILTHLPRIIDTELCVFQLNDTLPESTVELL